MILFLLLLCCVSAMAQPTVSGPSAGVFNFPSSAQVFNPTNGFGIVATYWHEPAISGYPTNASTVTVANLTSGGTFWDYTNKAAQSTWPIRKIGGVNSLDYLAFPSGKYLESVLATNAPVTEIFLVLSLTNNGTAQQLLDSDGTPQMLNQQNGVNWTISQGSSRTLALAVTNQWVILDAVFQASASSTGYTNTPGGSFAQTLAGSAGTAGGNGMVLGAAAAKNFTARMGYFGDCGFTNVTLTTLQRSNVFFYWRSRIGI